jgi:outer membrane protein insertion porin family/translocation and assembly module TamA
LIDTSTVVDTSAHSARVNIFIAPNHLTTVGDIALGGIEKVSPTTLLNTLTFRPGDVFRRSAVLESQRNLYESSLFKLAVLEVPASFDSVKSISVTVREAQLHEARTSFGFNTVDFLQVEGRYTDYNLFGGARRLNLSATAGNLAAGTLNGKGLFKRQIADTSITGNANDFLKPTWQTSVGIQQMAFLNRPHNALGAELFAQRRAVPAVVIDNGYGGDVTFTHSLGVRAPLSLLYRFEVTRVEAGGPYFCVNFGVCESTTISTLRGHERLSPLVAEAQVDRTDTPLNPSRGYTAHVQLEHASALTISDYRYNRIFGEGTLFSRLGGKESVLASHLKFGFVRALAGGADSEPVLHPRKRFYAGGSTSVRGFGENQLGPRVLTLPAAYLVHGLTASGAPCDVTSEAVRLCDPNTVTDSAGKSVDNQFTPRPTGGTSLLEGSVEYRFPLPILKDLGGAIFVDGAVVGESNLDRLSGVGVLHNLVRGTYAITPGIGVRYYSSVGPIRVDMGFNPSRAEDLAVVTEIVKNGKAEVIPLDIPKRFSAIGSGGGPLSFLQRFTLHLSIGQAY